MARDFMSERKRQLTLEMTANTDEIIEQIRPLLAGRSADTQGLVVAELAAIWLGGHRPDMRREMLKIFLDTTLDMVALHDPWQ